MDYQSILVQVISAISAAFVSEVMFRFFFINGIAEVIGASKS